MPEVTEGRFEAEMTVDEAMALHPAARWVFAAYHLGGCSICSVSNEETLAQVAQGYGLPLEKLLGDLNSLLTS
ncbi:MAG TPA: disulfide oxidoreductase [Thermoanaerobaculia bacterium]|nr:disulfide oxidoreductase [Thermoanaerobaculia bacterium]